MSSPQFVFKFPNFIRQFSSGTVYTDPLPFSPPVYHIPEGVSVPKLFYNPFQPVAKSVVFQRKSTVKKKKEKKTNRSFIRNTIDPLRILSSPSIFISPSLISHHSFATSRRRPSRGGGESVLGERLFRRARIFEQVPHHTTSANNTELLIYAGIVEFHECEM